MTVALIMVGLPARGKTYTARRIARHLDWLGHRSKVFNVGNYRRQQSGADVPHQFFSPQNEDGLKARRQAAQSALTDMIAWLRQGGEVAVFDATNSTQTRRNWLLEQLAQHGIQSAFVESICEDGSIIDTNIEQSKLTSPDYVGKAKEEALTDFKARIAHYVSTYEPLTDGITPWIKIIDAGRKVILHRISGPILIKVAHLVSQLNLMPTTIWLTRHGQSIYNTQDRVGGDSSLSPNGRFYANSLSDFMQDVEVDEVWTSTLVRTVQTASRLGRSIQRWKILDEIHAGMCDGLTYAEIKEQFPEVAEGRSIDKLRYRYPQGESYEDVIRRVEPIILALEHRSSPVLVVAHQAILRVIYGYFMDYNKEDVPRLSIPLHTVIRLTPSTYGCSDIRFCLPPHLETPV
jgi:broad specificity phosphatase PhoE/predicted kinase